MNLQPELHVALVAMRREEIQREVAGGHAARYAGHAPLRPWAPVRQLWAALAHAVPGAPRPRVA